MQSANVDFSAPVSSIDELLLLDDEQFVRVAYLTLLGRHVDPDGLASYLGHLRSGRDKSELIADLALSEEGRGVSADVIGLSALLNKFETRKPPLGVQFVKRLTTDALSPIRTQLRAIDNRLYRFEVGSAEYSLRSAADIADLRRSIQNQSEVLDNLRFTIQTISDALRHGGLGTVTQSTSVTIPADDSMLTQQARKILHHLRLATSKVGAQF